MRRPIKKYKKNQLMNMQLIVVCINVILCSDCHSLLGGCLERGIEKEKKVKQMDGGCCATSCGITNNVAASLSIKNIKYTHLSFSVNI